MSKNIWKRLSLMATTAIVAISLLSTAGIVGGIGISEAQAAEIVDSGWCDLLYWTLDSEGVLTIDGEGEMVSDAFLIMIQ